MRIAITADLHLTQPEKHPERFAVLENILAQMRQEKISTIIIAGDLFDSKNSNIAAFESICQRPENQALRIIILPGNHDLFLTNAYFAAQNIRVIEEPATARFSQNGTCVFLLPYQSEKTMGEILANYKNKLPPNQWILISHGDWTGRISWINSNQSQIYMPLTRQDLQLFKPVKVVLGHIHAPLDDPIYYVGSPCGLDITETGQRRFLMVDLDTTQIESKPTDADILFFNEHFFILPFENEADAIQKMLTERINHWNIQPEQHAKVTVRVRCSGFSKNRDLLQKLLNQAFEKYQYYQNEAPDLSNVRLAKDNDRFEITQQVLKRIHEMPELDDPYTPNSDQIIQAALNIIYGD
jgi:DNA repair exonuclease SbcCD nuclease subunit